MNHLAGLVILVTRDVRQAADLSDKLAAKGATVVEFPLLEIRSPDSTVALDAAILGLDRYDWVIFASTNAVDFFLQRMLELGTPTERLKSLSLGAVGARTKAQLEQHGLDVAFAPEEYSGEAFTRELSQKLDLKGLRFLWPRTNVGKLVIKERLEAAGGSVDAIVAYETHLPKDAEARAGELMELLGSDQLRMITLTSSQAVRNLHQLIANARRENGKLVLRSSDGHALTVATIGAETTKTVNELFDCRVVQSESSTIPDLVACIERFFDQIPR